MDRLEHARILADRLVFRTEEALLNRLDTLNSQEDFQKVYDHFSQAYPDVPNIAKSIKLYAALKGFEIK